MSKKVCFATPTITKPHPKMLDSMEAEVPFMQKAGLEEVWVWEVGHAYVSYARTALLRKALRWFGEDDGCIVYVDHDVEWRPGDLTRLATTPGDVVAGTYRLKSPQEEYMGRLDKLENDPIPAVNHFGCLPAFLVPAGFLKITRNAVEQIVRHYPHLNFSRDQKDGDHFYDLFNHGVINNTWFGEDYAFSLRWKLMKNPIWLVPDLQIDHWGKDAEGRPKSYKGNFAEYLAKEENREAEIRKGQIQYVTDNVTAAEGIAISGNDGPLVSTSRQVEDAKGTENPDGSFMDRGVYVPSDSAFAGNGAGRGDPVSAGV